MRCVERLIRCGFRRETLGWFEDIVRTKPEGQTRGSECLKLTALFITNTTPQKLCCFLGANRAFRVSLPVPLCPGAKTTTIEAVAAIWSRKMLSRLGNSSSSAFRFYFPLNWLGFCIRSCTTLIKLSARMISFVRKASSSASSLPTFPPPLRFKDRIFCVVKTFSLAGST